MPKRSFSDFEDKKKVNAWSEKNELKAHEVSIYSHKKAIFKCYNKDCGHEFKRYIYNITSGSWCPFCAKYKKTLCGEKSCIPCRKNSFVSFHDKDKVNAWSDKNELKSHEVPLFSSKTAIFKCYNEECGREFELMIYQVSSHGNQWCPCCNGNTFCNKSICIPCYNKSFSSFKDKDKVNSWSEKNEFKQNQVKFSSDKKAIFKCYNEECGREFELKIDNVTSGKQWCPCCNSDKFCNKSICIPCYNKSFSSFKDKDKVNSWSDKNEFKQNEVSLFSSKKAIFKCFKCEHEFKSIISQISRGRWCKFCHAMKNKFIKKLVEIFYDMGIKYDVEVSVKCGGRILRWDMVVYNNKREFYIESDGEHHFSFEGLVSSCRTNISNEKAQKEFEYQREKDLLKEKHIVDNNKLLFRISYNQFDDLEELVQEMISKSNKKNKGVVKMDDIYDW